jgi:hypothetical protein
MERVRSPTSCTHFKVLYASQFHQPKHLRAFSATVSFPSLYDLASNTLFSLAAPARLSAVEARRCQCPIHNFTPSILLSMQAMHGCQCPIHTARDIFIISVDSVDALAAAMTPDINGTLSCVYRTSSSSERRPATRDVRFVARYKRLTGPEDSSQCSPRLPRAMRYPALTDCPQTIPLASALSDACASALCSF